MSNVKIIQETQNFVLKQVNNAPWFIATKEIHKILNMPLIKEVIDSHSSRYKSQLLKYRNQLVGQLRIPETARRLKNRQDIFDE